MKSKKIKENTTNRGEFNKAYKNYLANTGKIKCSHCGFHKGENKKDKEYFSIQSEIVGNKELNHPSWKLISKNEKQWMEKNINYKINVSSRMIYLEIII